MIKYIIDGNNLIGKIKHLKELQRKNKQQSREGLVALLNGYFAGKKNKATLHFDGYPNAALHFSKGKTLYSENRSSDSFIREEIDHSKNPKLIILISSDHSLINYARANSCSVIKSEDFYSEVKKISEKNDEEEKINQLKKEKELFQKLFSE